MHGIDSDSLSDYLANYLCFLALSVEGFLDKAYEDIKDNRCRFVSGDYKISVEMIGENSFSQFA